MRLYKRLFFWGIVMMCGVGIMMVCGICCDGNNNQKKLAQEYKNLFLEKIDTSNDLMAIFPKRIEDIHLRVEQAKAYAEKELQAIYSIKSENRTFDNTIQAIDTIQSRFDSTIASLLILLNMSPDKNILQVAQQETDRMHAFEVDLFLDKKVYQAYREYLDHQGKLDVLDDEQRYFLSEQMASFKRAGFTLSDKTFAMVKNVEKQLNELSTQFEVNINTANKTIIVAPQDTAGINEKLLASYKKDEEGRYIIPCNGPSYSEIMQECHVPQTRKLMSREFAHRGYPANIGLLEQIIALRDKSARLTGYTSFAALDIEPTMAKTPARVQAFLSTLQEKSRPKWLKELQEYTKDLPRGVVKDETGRINAWDIAYIFSQYKKKYLAIDNNEIAKYFEAQKTLNSIFQLYQQTLGLRFLCKKPSWSWHSDVDLLEIYDATTNEFIGDLLLDLYPRDNKCGHAGFYSPIIPPQQLQTSEGKTCRKPSLAIILANFPKGTDNAPALLKHNDVVTFFHEFGHAMHGVLGGARFATRSGTSVAVDFVEVPSQAFEEWMFDKEILKKLSCHYKTGQPLPDNVIENISKSIQFDSGYFHCRQAVMSQIVLAYAMSGEKKDTDSIWQDTFNAHIPEIVLDPDTHPQSSFVHFIWYRAKYYSYMWSKVMALDVFAKLKEEHLSGKRFADLVLSKGGSKNPNVLIKNYLGRESSMDAFLSILGMNS